ncbi:MAG: hypothetical protein GX308_06730 [Epulopiscium sp.]|nr:hypothetical protein [Candidatus Epulonipiscium sp.]
MNELGILLGMGIIIGLIGIVVGILFYVLMSLGLYGMAQKAGIDNAWFAWIPFLNMYIIGKLIGTLEIFDQKIPSMELVLPIVNIVASVLSGVKIIGLLLGVINYILLIISLNTIYKMYKKDNATVMTVLSAIFPFTIPFFLFSLRALEPNVEVSENIVNM